MEILKSEQLYSGPIFDLQRYNVRLPNGKVAKRDVLLHNGAAVVIAVAPDGRLVTVRQYRHGPQKVMLELPAGKLDPGEEPKACALRELKEETGYRAQRIRQLFMLHPVAAYCSEEVYMFLAEELTQGQTNLDEGEFVEVELHRVENLLSMIEAGEISDMKTVAGVLYYARIRASS